jgi:hypothetical protein
MGGVPVWAVAIEMRFLSGKSELEESLKYALQRPA